MNPSRTRAGKDTWFRAGKRFVEVGVHAGIVRDACSPRLAEVLGQVIRHGLNVRTIHAVHAVLHPRRVAMIDDHRQVTYADANAEINRLGNAVNHRIGIHAGAPVILMMENRIEYLVAWIALFRLGASGVHASYRMTADELGYQVDHSGARVLFVSAQSLAAARQLDAARGDLDLTIVLVGNQDAPRGVVGYRELIASASTDFVTPDLGRWEDADSANIVYTSGTTGAPKGTVRDFGRFGVVELSRILDRLDLQADDNHLVVAPMYHSGGQVFTLLNSTLAATLVLRPRFDAKDALDSLSTQRIDTSFMVPTMIRRILDLPDSVHRQYPTPQLRALISGAAPFPEELRRRAMRRFGQSTVHDFYGATELGWVTLIDGDEMARRPGSVGRPLAGQQVRIVDHRHHDVPRGEVGKIWVRNQHAMSGYLRDELASEDIRDGDWVTVDDLGYLDDDDYLYLAGRCRDMVISGGVNIYPVEIEQVLVAHASVEEAAVIGLADQQWGESLVAVVVGADGRQVDVDELEAHARNHLAGLKVPRRWQVVDELPRNPTGKILKSQLESSVDASR